MKYIFFGTGALAESALAALVRAGYIPSLVVTKPDRATGRHQTITPPYIKTWCELKNIPVLQPETLKNLPEGHPLFDSSIDISIVASYGFLIPDNVLYAPKNGTINIHPSALPSYRGPSPIESSLLDGLTISAITIMQLDSGMDTGNIFISQDFIINPQDTAGTLEVRTGQEGGELLVSVLPHIIDKTLTSQPQSTSGISVTRKMNKEDGLIDLADSPLVLIRKYKALTPWPGLHFFIFKDNKNIRVKINKVTLSAITSGIHLTDLIEEVTPEGKQAMSFSEFKKGYL